MKLKDKLWEELEDISRSGEMSGSDLEMVHKITDTIKNIDKICMLESGGEDGYSNARRHYVRGHYSRDGGYDDYEYARGDNNGRGYNGRYPRDDGRDNMMSHLTAAMATSSEEDREMIRRMMDKIQGR